MKRTRVLVVQHALLWVPFPALLLMVGVGSVLAAAVTVGVSLLIMATVVVWELKAYPI
ncbi:hypothetical protein [Streptomyces sp. NPDC057748]|uniref:hypothetical protein n=1 Tax=unclassified Streptomyces TaxID=2593676 RepID=UPI00367C1C8F